LNFVGTFDAKLPIEGPGAHPNAQLHVDSVTTHAPADAIIVPDAHLLFTGDFKRSGVDLILSKDAHELVLQDYFKGEKRAALASPDGAHLTGDLVNTLAGHVDYAQADGSASVATVIGHVTKLMGSGTAIRNGVSIILNQGDNVDKGDVVQAGSDSTLGITFIDGTVFGLSSNAKMVLNEMVYDPNGSNNSSLLSLVAGTISFVAGETAKHGDMKIDTPVATMGIRGTAVLVEIDFDVPQGGGPDAKFQVLVEPDGTTGSYILFDKNTLDPIATVNQAGTQTIFSHGIVSFLNTAPLSPDAQKLITEVFAEKFTDNTNVNTKNFDHYTDTLLPQTFTPFSLSNGATAVPVFLYVPAPAGAAPASASGPSNTIQHINQAPTVSTTGGAITEISGVTHSTTADPVSGTINFVDVNAGDFPTAKTSFTSFTYQNAAHTDVTSTLSALQLKDIGLVEANLVVVPTPGNNNNGSATWTYSVGDSAFDFLAAGETLTLTYTAEVDSNYLPNNLATFSTFTITITGTNDAPVITTGPQTIAFAGGINIPGGDLTTNVPTHGTLDFTDADLTDTHTVSTKLTAMSLSGATVPPAPLAIFENALSASIATDSSGTGNGTIDWKLADLPVYLADFIPNGQTLTLTYTVTLTDSQGAPTTQNVIVNITGTGTPAVVWIATTSGPSSGGLWSDPSSWETGTAPTPTDDAIIITDQLIGLMPSYPVTISGTPAVAKSLTMNDFGALFTNQPRLVNDSTLTIGAGGITLHADAIVENGDATHVSAKITVGGAMEVLDQSTLRNYGQITLQGGGDFKDLSTVANFSSGTIEVAGGTLNVQVGIANSGAVTIDPHATLTLNGGAISGGTVTNTAGGTLDLAGGGVVKDGRLANAGTIDVTGTGNALDHETVTVNYSLEVMAGGELTLDLGTTVANGTITVDGALLTLNSDGTTSTTPAAALTLNSAVITGGGLSNYGTVFVEGSVGATFDDVSVTNSRTIQVDVIMPAGPLTTLTLDDGTSIAGGHLNIGSLGVLEIAYGTTGPGATLDGGVSVGNSGVIQIDNGATLTLNGATINGGTVNDFSSAGGGIIDVTGASTIAGTSASEASLTGAGAFTSKVTLDAALTLDDVRLNDVSIEKGSSGALTIDDTVEVAGPVQLLNDTVTNSGIIQVDDGQTLTLNGATINGGTVNDFSSAGGDGTIDVTGSSKIDGNASLNNGYVTIESGKTLTLDNVTVTGTEIDGTDGGPGATSIIQIDSGTTLTLSSGASVHDGTINISSNGILEIEASSGATLNGVSITGTGHTQIDGPTVSSGLLLEGGTSMTGGTLTIGSVGTLEIATALGATLNNVRVINNYMIEVLAGGILTLDLGTTVANATGTIDIDPAGSTACAATLELNGTTVNGGTINDNGTIDVTGNSAINGITAHFHTTSAALNDGSVTVENGVILTLDDVAVTGTTFNDSGTIKVDNNRKLALNDVTVNGGTISDSGTIDITGDSSIHGITANAVTSNAILNVSDVTVESGDTLALDNVTANGTTFDDAGATLAVIDTLVLNGVTINGGTVSDGGTIDVTGNSSIHGITSFFGFGTTTNAVLNNGFVTVESGKILTLDNVTVNGTAFNDSGTVGVDDDDALVLNGAAITGGKLAGNGFIEATGSGNALNNVAVTDTGTIEVSAGGALTLDLGTTVDNTHGVITIDGAVVTGRNAAPAATMTLNLATINGGTINDNGTIDVTGNSSINGTTVTTWFGATITTNAVLNGGKVTVETGSRLTLDNVTVNSSTFNDYGTLQIDSGAMLMLAGIDLIAGISGSSIANAGTIDITGTTTLDTDSLTDTGTLKVDGTLKLIHTAITGGTITDNGTIDVTSDSSINGTTANAILNGGKVTVESGVTLTLDNDTVSGTKFTDAGTIHVDSGKTLTLDNVSINGGSITDDGTGTIHIDSGKTLTLDNVTVTGGSITNAGTIHVDSGKTLTLDNVTMTGGTITNSGTIQVDSGDKLTLNDVSVSGGTINDNGTIVITGGTTIASNTAIHGTGVFEIDASAKNETLTHYGSSDNFVFNFANASSVGHDTVSHFDVVHDVLEFSSSSIFAYATNHIGSDNHGNAVISLDGSGDTITLTGVTKAQLLSHMSDFHFV
jgi:fibronectin-binding autotransporter adhesin